MEQEMSKFSVAVAAAAAFVVPAIGFAAHADSAPAKEISLKGYDLTDPQDVQAIERRIESAARDLCTSGGRATLEQRMAQTECMQTSKSAAMAKLEERIAEARYDVAAR